MHLPYSAACERNAEPICTALRSHLLTRKTLLEIGSGTGQHAVYFAQRFPHLTWQCSDRIQNHVGILAWIADAQLSNVLPPIALDVASSTWPSSKFDAAFTANTCHIMAWDEVVSMFAGVTHILCGEGKFFVYGPFNYAGKFTSASNQAFDHSLKTQAHHMGIRDIEALQMLALQNGLSLVEDIEMPANNRLLVFTLKVKI